MLSLRPSRVPLRFASICFVCYLHELVRHTFPNVLTPYGLIRFSAPRALVMANLTLPNFQGNFCLVRSTLDGRITAQLYGRSSVDMFHLLYLIAFCLNSETNIYTEIDLNCQKDDNSALYR